MDEIGAVELLITAAEELVHAPILYPSPAVSARRLQRGNFSAEGAAGVFFEERQATLKCLLKLLAEVAGSMARGGGGAGGGCSGAYSRIVRSFVDDLLGSGGDGEGKLLSRIIEVGRACEAGVGGGTGKGCSRALGCMWRHRPSCSACWDPPPLRQNVALRRP
eukprot:363357-Chlamydomonas_euryale.AAC.15